MRAPCGVAVAALVLAAAAPVRAEPPAAGRYDARLCVTLGAAAPSCGPTETQVLSASRVHVRISDVVYRLQLHSSQVEVVLMHGAVPVDEFVANYEWTAGPALEFVDVDKRTRYALHFAGPAR
jgi:hypothetical protein